MEKISKRILSGVQPSGDLHLGNYLGAIKNFVSLQKEFECFFCVVDLHAITVWQDPKILKRKTREVAAAFIASGIDPEKNTLFVQSQVPQHAQLAWIFNCVARMGWLNRMTQFKDKAGKNSENVSVGLFSYPTLMAADILIYLATHVPVGEDQKQHLELTRDIAQKFNSDFNTDIFPIPEPLILGAATRVMSLRDGLKKMSKSDPSDYSRIMLSDSEEEIQKKIRKAKTDPLPLPDNIEDAKKRPEAINLLTIYAALNDLEVEKAVTDYAGKEFSQFKKDLGELASAKLSPISQEMNKLMKDEKYLDSIISKGKDRAISVADPVLSKIYEIIGFFRD
jgi:tryptophanyl-tRNA synthetase